MNYTGTSYISYSTHIINIYIFISFYLFFIFWGMRKQFVKNTEQLMLWCHMFPQLDLHRKYSERMRNPILESRSFWSSSLYQDASADREVKRQVLRLMSTLSLIILQALLKLPHLNWRSLTTNEPKCRHRFRCSDCIVDRPVDRITRRGHPALPRGAFVCAELLWGQVLRVD